MGCIASKQTVSVTPAWDFSGAFRSQGSSSGILASRSSSLRNRSQNRGSGREESGEDDVKKKNGKKKKKQSKNWFEGPDPRAVGVGGIGEESGRSAASSSVVIDPIGNTSTRSNQSVSFRLGNLTRYVEGEQVAAGWPAWLSAVAGEAIQGWVPLKADSFEKLEKVGQGTYSSVFRARDLETGRTVALKKVRFDNFEPESVRFMAREIQILRKLDHPNIIKLEGLITSRLSCSLYLVFEYMEHDLAGLSSCPTISFSESQVKCYMNQLLSGLEHCHSHGIMHRDIKGANLLVNNEGTLKIADFGLANNYSPNQRHPLTSRVVTLWYRPPELLLGSTNYGATVDLWSVGCVFAEMLIGRPILQGRTEVEQLHKIFKLCGSPSDEYWRKSKLPHATIFKPQQPYEGCLQDTLKDIPESAISLIKTLLSVEPYKRGTASTALASEYFRTKPYACDPSSLPKYPPNKEIDAKVREDDARRKRTMGKGTRGSDGTRRAARVAKVSDSINRFAPESQGVKDGLNGLHSGNSRKVNIDKGNVNSGINLLKSTIDLPEEVCHRKNDSQEDIPFSGPLPVSGSTGFAWAKRRKEDTAAPLRSHRRSKSRALSSVSSDSSSALRRIDSSGLKDQANGNTKEQSVAKQGIMQRRGNFGLTDSFDASEAYHSQDFSSTLSQNEQMAFKPHILNYHGFQDEDNKVDFSGPILSHSSKVDEFLEKHERHIRQAVRRSWFQRGKKGGRKDLGE
ncbi:protein IMPAIRED IN BABA-INDUCED STERILITY 1-like isoform X1 [Nymphaea colorata]|nr:protein IMPAIRED IN BABA-INDUCED STERILITY 1-like isoform X1 [Nymphaea colorata]